ncbi:putative DNA binding domain-containing protein [Magnetovirga frankeli]|uniref:RNA-binding domain-containing protein n=1 Tax=Magnetovirga frankeli TaxID=947516 RepID=UPI001293A831|nr:putative DNA binding domain-containing protein [gamma proteobacterium SS-5]
MTEYSQEINAGESEGIEFKRSTSLLKEAIQSLCAFANHKGGVLYFGVADDGQIIGQSVTDDTLKNIANTVKLNTEPKLYPQIEKVQFDGMTCIRVSIEQSPLKPHVAYGRAYIRVGSTTQQLSQDQYQLMLQQRNNGYGFDFQPCTQASMADIDEASVRQFIETANAVRDLNQSIYLPVDQVMEKLDLLKQGIISNAGILLFGKNPERFFSGHYEIKAASFPADTGYDEMTNEQEYNGNLIDVFAKAQGFLLNSLRKSYKKGEQSGSEHYEFPKAMLREALVNMIVHRDYRIDVKSTIEVRPSWISFYNPAQLFTPTITLETLKRHHPSRPGNKLIARVFYLMGLFENWGSGTLKIIESAKQSSRKEPRFDFQDGMFRLIIERQQ